jgi:spore coat protein U-like protein
MRTKVWRGSTATAAIAAALLAAPFAAPAFAATATANLSVTATVTNNCTISTTPVAFGVYDPVVAHASTNLDGTGTVVVTCTKGAVTTVGLGLGSNVTGSTRRLKDAGTNYLTYELYRDAGRVTVWGTAGGALLSPGAAPSKAARTFTVYGQIPANQDIPAGTYTDTVVATVNF